MPVLPWKQKLDLVDPLNKYESFEMTVEELAEETAKRVRELRTTGDPYVDEKIEGVCEEFDLVTEEWEFYDAMTDLYDWADYDKNIWVETP